MNAEAYISQHWLPKNISEHLKSPKHQQRFDWIAERLPAAGRFIDVGCACGHSTAELAARVGGEWTGIDFSESAIKEAVRVFSATTFHCLKTSEELSALGQFDGVVCSEVLEHVPDPAGMVRALNAITGGTLVLTTPAQKVNDPGHLWLFTVEELAAFFPADPPAKIEHLGTFHVVTWKQGRKTP